MKNIILIFFFLKIDIAYQYILLALAQAKAKRISLQTGCVLNFVPQGGYNFDILGDINNFKIHESSHIKSGTYIECSGGVQIGAFFHCGRGLTIYSSNHNWRNCETLPYDTKSILKPVIIGDAVWVGANVTILPGVTLGHGSVIAAGSVVVKDVSPGTVVGGNPAVKIAQRDMSSFKDMFDRKKFF